MNNPDYEWDFEPLPAPAVCPLELLMPNQESGEKTPDRRPKARLTHWGNLCYTYPDHGKEPVTVEIRHSAPSESEEQVYRRFRTTEGTLWKEAETGWVANPLMVTITNDAPSGGGVLHVALTFEGVPAKTHIVLPPGSGVPLQLVVGCRAWVCSPSGDPVPYTVTAFPR